jgi:phosphate:Na+ symporter
MKAADPLGNDISGDNQVGTVTRTLKDPLVIRVVDDKGYPVMGAPVGFKILEQPKENIINNKFALLSDSLTMTDQDGYAMTDLVFGESPGNYYIIAEAGNETLIFKAVALQKNWLLYLLFSVVGGLGIFIFGLNYGSKGLMRAAGAKMRDLLFNLTKHRILALITGVVVTVILGSSTASSILLVKFASSGIIMLQQALGVLMGINIGTTITVQILAFHLLDYAILIVGIGFFIMHLVPRLKNTGQAVFGLGLLFFSLRLMSMATANLKYLPNFSTSIASMANIPLLGILVGALLAFILRSSAATIGIILILAFDSLIELPQAIPLILGANLGTTFSSIISANTVEGRRVALGHLSFNGLAIAILYPFLGRIPGIMSWIGGDTARQIANMHTAFNIFTAIIFLPLLGPVTRLLDALVKNGKDGKLKHHRLSTAFLSAPGIALGQSAREILDMSDTVIRMVEMSMDVFRNRDDNMRKKIIDMDNEVDCFEETITPYLVKITESEMNSKLSGYHRALMNAVNELENIGDVISKKIMVYAKKQIDTGFVFSDEGFTQIQGYYQFVLTTLRMSIDALATRDKRMALTVAERKKTGYQKAKELNEQHIERLKRGLKESLETSSVHVDLISDLERINFHAVIIAEGLL